MKGIYYCRQDGTDRDDWHQPVAGETIILPRKGFTAHFPNVEIQGGIEWRCEEWAASERCDGCMDSCGNVQLKFDGEGEFAVSYVNDKPNRFIREFRWGWSGHGTNEWWFDSGAISLKAPREDYRSGSGLTASSSRIVAYNRNVGVDCFREDCGDEVSFPEGGGITAGFVNADGGYRANWTGFAVSQNFITDQLDELIKIELGEREPVEPTVCRHNRQVQVGILTNDSKKVSYFLCLACRQKGVRWEEFTRRNQRDICPYFRRACKGVTEKLDQFPDWFRWDGDNLLSAHRRMQDDGWEAYEVTYVRRKEGFVRRAVLLFNLRTRETWMYRYAGFIPNTIQVFRDKFSEGRRILGYGGTGRNKDQANWDDPESGFLAESMVIEAVTGPPLWRENGHALFSFKGNPLDTEECPIALQKAQFGSYEIVPMDGDKEAESRSKSGDPQVFYVDPKGNQYYLILIGQPWVGGTSVRRNGQEVASFDYNTSDWYLFMTPPV